MSVTINNPKNTDLDNNTAWITPLEQGSVDHTQNSGSTPTISVHVTSREKHPEDLEQAMDQVIQKNEQLYERLAE
jgi:hypothetical protein